MTTNHHEARGHEVIVATKHPQVREVASTATRHDACNSAPFVRDHDHVDPEHLLEVLRTEFRRLSTVRADRVSELDDRIASLEQDLRATEQLLVAAERQAARLAGLYAAAYQLHSLDPTEIGAALSEIAVDLLGARKCVLLLASNERPGAYDVIDLVRGSVGTPPFVNPLYFEGDTLVDASLADGHMRVGADVGSPLVAAVPLMMQSDVVGAMVLVELLPQKKALLREDRELLELLGAHAGSALVGARVFQDTQRKLKTLEGLVSLLRRSPGGAR